MNSGADKSMRAIAITPGVEGSARLLEVPVPEPANGEVRVRVLRVGVDGTDAELVRGEYGEPPAGEELLIIGHESLGCVETVGEEVTAFAPGDLVVAMVRRPDDCRPCSLGEPDLCVKGEYRERGIKGQHGFLAEAYVERPEFLIKLPQHLAETGGLDLEAHLRRPVAFSSRA